jgi:DNA-directed RNA polymerase specialized sigma subunit
MSAADDLQTRKRVIDYQHLSLLEKEALFACTAAREAIIEILVELQQPTRRRRITAQQFLRLVGGIRRNLIPQKQLFTELLAVPMNMENWNAVRKAAEHEKGPEYDKWHQLLDQSSELRNELILDHIYLAKSLACTFGHQDPQLTEDFESYAVIGLIRALDSFKPELEIPFAGHAYKWIVGYLSNQAERQSIVNPTKTALHILAKYRDCKAKLAASLNRAPLLEEVAEHLEIPLEKLSSAIPLCDVVFSLDAEQEDGTTLHEHLQDPSVIAPSSDLDILKESIMRALSLLSEPERISAAFCIPMDVNDVTATTTYPLADVVPFVREWTKTRLLDLLAEDPNAKK